MSTPDRTCPAVTVAGSSTLMRWLAAFALVGCVQPAPQLLCGDTVFPASQVCSDGSAEGAACTINDVPGRCNACGNQLVCVPAACGDGVIDGELHEQCDGASSVATTGTQCADVGYDLGLLGCTTSCAFDPTACIRFGWQHYIDARVVSFWADGAVTAYAKTCDHCTTDDTPELHVTGGDFDLVVPGTFSLVTGGEIGTGLRIVAAGLTNNVRDIFVVQPDGLHPTSYPGHGDVASIAVGDDDEIYAITSCSGSSIPPNATLYVYDSQQWSSASLRCDAVNPPKLAIGSSPSKRLFIANTSDGSTIAAGTVLEAGPPWSAPKLTPRLNPPQTLAIHDIAVRTAVGPEALYVVATTQADDALFRMPLGVNTITSEGPLVADATLAFSNTAVFALSGIDGRTKRWDGDVFDDLRAPGGVIADDHHGALYVYTVGSPIYRFTGSTFGELDAPLLQHDMFPDDHVVAALDLKSATIVAAAHELFTYEPPSDAWVRTITTYPDPMRALAGSSSSSYAVSTYSDPTSQIGVGRAAVHYHVGTVDTDISAPAHPYIDGLWMDGSGELYAAGFTLDAMDMPSAYFAQTKPSTTPGATTWTLAMPQTPGCSVNAVTGGTTQIFAGGACNGIAQIWTLDAATLSMTTFPDITGAFYAIKSLPDGEIFAIGDAGAVWLESNGTSHTYPDVAGRSISGAPDDIWVAGVNTPIQHFSAGVWSRMTTNPVGQMAISVSPTGNRVLMPGAASGFVSLLREP